MFDFYKVNFNLAKVGRLSLDICKVGWTLSKIDFKFCPRTIILYLLIIMLVIIIYIMNNNNNNNKFVSFVAGNNHFIKSLQLFVDNCCILLSHCVLIDLIV